MTYKSVLTTVIPILRNLATSLAVAVGLIPGLLPAAPADEGFFTNGIACTFRLQMDEAALKQLKAGNREYVRATLTEGVQTFPDVGLRLKGHGCFRPVTDKPGFTVKFNQFNPDQKFDGLTKLQFNNAVHDPSHLREALATQMCREAGVPAPRVTHACLTLNGRDLGLYVVVEGANKVFLRRHFQDATGNLYEGFLQDVDGQPEQDSGTNTTRADLQALAQAASLPDPEQRLAAVGRFLDVDRLLTFVAMETLTARGDGYARGMANYRLYHDPATDRMVFIAHGMVGAFAGTNVTALPPTRSLLGKAVFQTEPGRRAYRQRLRELFERVYRVEALTNRVRREIARLSTNGLSMRSGVRSIHYSFGSRPGGGPFLCESSAQRGLNRCELPSPAAARGRQGGGATPRALWGGRNE